MVTQSCTFLTLAGEKLSIEVDLNAHTGIRSFENAVLAELPYLGSSSTLGCELQFVQLDTCQVLADPIQSKLRANHCYYVIARPCLVEAAHKGQIKGEAKAIRVPRGKNDKIPPQAFSFHTEVRHVLVEPGMRIVGEAVEKLSAATSGPTTRNGSQSAAWCVQMLPSLARSNCPWLPTFRPGGIRGVLLPNSNRSDTVP